MKEKDINNVVGMSEEWVGVEIVVYVLWKPISCAGKESRKKRKSEAAPRPSLFRGVRQFVWNHLESVSCHFAEQLQPLSTKHSRVVTRQFSKKTTSTSRPPERSSLRAYQKRLPGSSWDNPGILRFLVFSSLEKDSSQGSLCLHIYIYIYKIRAVISILY